MDLTRTTFGAMRDFERSFVRVQELLAESPVDAERRIRELALFRRRFRHLAGRTHRLPKIARMKLEVVIDLVMRGKGD